MTPCCKGVPSHTAVHTAQLLHWGDYCFVIVPYSSIRNAQKSALFDAALDGTISGFVDLVLNKTELNTIKVVSDT